MPKANEIRLEKPKGLGRWLWIFRNYRQSFPPSERKPFSVIVNMYRRGKTDVWCILADGKMAGFASTINGAEEILLDYLAVDSRRRGEGIGSGALKAIREMYRGWGVFGEIESPYEPGEDREIRLHRKAFYLRSGMRQMNVMAKVFGVKMELIGWDCQMDFAGYKAFYRDNYGAWAAEHIEWEPHPDEKQDPGSC